MVMMLMDIYDVLGALAFRNDETTSVIMVKGLTLVNNLNGESDADQRYFHC